MKFQRDNSVPPWWADMLEVNPSLHLHLLAAAPFRKANVMCRAIEGSTIHGDVDARPVPDMNGLVGYLLGEVTTEAHYGLGPQTRRIPGSHKIPDGGDRQRLSRGLTTALIGARLIEPWTRTNARRKARAVAVEALRNDIERARIGLFFAEDIPEAMTTTRRPKAKPTLREKIPPPSLPMMYPPTVIDLLAEMRKHLTCEQIAERVGLSRQQTNNVAVERFGVSRKVRERVLELARAA